MNVIVRPEDAMDIQNECKMVSTIVHLPDYGLA